MMKTHKGLRIWQKIIIALLVLVIGVGMGAYVYVNHMLDNLDKIDVDKDKLGIVDVDGYINFLIMGIDSRDMNDFKDSRTDALILVSLEEKTNKVKLTSIYRDTMLKMGDTDKYDKITHAFAYDGPANTVKSINQSMDLNVDKFVVINWKTVVDMVNAAGGVTLDIEDYEIDEMNRCTEETASVVGSGEYKPITSPGKQTVDGYQAVGYGRMRYGVGDDIKRTERMRTVIESLLTKLKKSSPNKIDKVLKTTMPLIKTNINKSDIFSLATRIPKFKVTKSESFPYNYTGGMIDGVYYLVPNTLRESVVELHKKVFGQKGYKPSQKVRRISEKIENISNGGNYVVDPNVVPPETNDVDKENNIDNENNQPQTTQPQTTQPDVTKPNVQPDPKPDVKPQPNPEPQPEEPPELPPTPSPGDSPSNPAG